MPWVCRVTAIADAWVAWLNDDARSWAGRFTAVRQWAPVTEFEDLDQAIDAQVVPIVESADELFSRAAKQQDYTTLLGLRQRYTPTAEALDAQIPEQFADELAGLLEEIADKLVDVELNSTGYRVFCHKREVDLSLVGAALKEKRSFLGFLEVTWRELRAR